MYVVVLVVLIVLFVILAVLVVVVVALLLVSEPVEGVGAFGPDVLALVVASSPVLESVHAVLLAIQGAVRAHTRFSAGVTWRLIAVVGWAAVVPIVVVT